MQHCRRGHQFALGLQPFGAGSDVVALTDAADPGLPCRPVNHPGAVTIAASLEELGVRDKARRDGVDDDAPRFGLAGKARA